MIDFGKVQADAVKNIYKSEITGKARARDYRILEGTQYFIVLQLSARQRANHERVSTLQRVKDSTGSKRLE